MLLSLCLCAIALVIVVVSPEFMEMNTFKLDSNPCIFRKTSPRLVPYAGESLRDYDSDEEMRARGIDNVCSCLSSLSSSSRIFMPKIQAEFCPPFLSHKLMKADKKTSIDRNHNVQAVVSGLGC